MQTVVLGQGNTVNKQATRSLIEGVLGGATPASIAEKNGYVKVNKDGSVKVKKGMYSDLVKALKAAKIKFTRFAQGGFIEDGVFTMNQNELAGKFNNGKSVVANNQQISEGFAKSITQTLAPAMYSAVKQAINESNADGGQNINVYLDGKQIAENNVKYIRQMNRASGRSQFA
jgi:hypothetical protein